MSNKLFVGVGNPGENYAKTRHNVGFAILDKLAQELGILNYELNKKLQSEICNYLQLILAKPQTFMNSSGLAVKKLSTYYKVPPTNIWVIHDDLDLRLGEYKIQKGVGPKLHYGVKSIEKELKSKDFWRVRIGVDNRSSDNRISGEEYVLQNFTNEEYKILEDVFDKILIALHGLFVSS